jgi:hypothetical protein
VNPRCRSTRPQLLNPLPILNLNELCPVPSHRILALPRSCSPFLSSCPGCQLQLFSAIPGCPLQLPTAIDLDWAIPSAIGGPCSNTLLHLLPAIHRYGCRGRVLDIDGNSCLFSHPRTTNMSAALLRYLNGLLNYLNYLYEDLYHLNTFAC